MILKILRWVISILYGGLTLYSSVIAILDGILPIWSCLLMASGAILLIIANHKYFHEKIYLIIIPLLLIHISALINGFFSVGMNISHHIFRLIISISIFTLFFFTKDKNL